MRYIVVSHITHAKKTYEPAPKGRPPAYLDAQGFSQEDLAALVQAGALIEVEEGLPAHKEELPAHKPAFNKENIK